jgi:hypothetical protein
MTPRGPGGFYASGGGQRPDLSEDGSCPPERRSLVELTDGGTLP